MVVTVHDLAFVHDPRQFSQHGVRIMRAASRRSRAGGPRDLLRAGRRSTTASGRARPDRLRLVPLGVDVRPAAPATSSASAAIPLPDEFVLFVGTVEPRKNLGRLAEAMRGRPASPGRRRARRVGRSSPTSVGDDVQFLGFVPDDDLGRCTPRRRCSPIPSEREGFGLPVAEAMAQGTPVVTSAAPRPRRSPGGGRARRPVRRRRHRRGHRRGVDAATSSPRSGDAPASCRGGGRRSDARRLP